MRRAVADRRRQDQQSACARDRPAGRTRRSTAPPCRVSGSIVQPKRAAGTGRAAARRRHVRGERSRGTRARPGSASRDRQHGDRARRRRACAGRSMRLRFFHSNRGGAVGFADVDRRERRLRWRPLHRRASACFGGSCSGGLPHRGFLRRGLLRRRLLRRRAPSPAGSFRGGSFAGGSFVGGCFIGGSFRGACIRDRCFGARPFHAGRRRWRRALQRRLGTCGSGCTGSSASALRSVTVGRPRISSSSAPNSSCAGPLERHEVVVRIEHRAAMPAAHLAFAQRELRGGDAKHRPHPGQRVNLLLEPSWRVRCRARSAARALAQLASRRRASSTQSSSRSPRAKVEPGRVRCDDVVRLRDEDARQRDAIRPLPSAPRSAGASTRSGLARMFATTTSNVAPARSASTAQNVAVDAVRVAHWRALAAIACGSMSAPRRRARRASPRRSRGCPSRSRSRAPRSPPRASCRSHGRHSRVVGCAPVPNARPGSSTMLIASGVRRRATRSGTIHRSSSMRIGCELRLRRAHPVLRRRRRTLGRRQRRAERCAAALRQRRRRRRRRRRSSAASARQRPPARRRCRRLVEDRRFGRRCPRADRTTSTDSAPASSSASDQASASAASTSKRSAGTRHVGAARQRRTACASRAAPRDSGSTCRRAGTSSSSSSSWCSGMLVLMPLDHHLRQRDAHARDRLLARVAVRDDLADHRVVVRRHEVVLVRVRVDADAGAARRVPRRDAPRRRHERLRVLGVDPAFDRVAAAARRRAGGSAASGRRRSRICSCTMSMPVMSSVTGCSTWTRVFISMKKNSSSSYRNSNVPAPR